MMRKANLLAAMFLLLSTGSPALAQVQNPAPPLALAAEQGDADAQFQLALKYRTGDGVLQNHAQAVDWLNLAAQQGHAPALNLMAQHVFEGLGIPQDQAVAVELFAKAAETGDPEFQADYASALLSVGQASEAARVFQLAAEQGHLGAQTSLGVLYQNGEGVPQDFAKAVSMYTGAAQAGVAKAQNNLGLLYVRGNGVAQDYAAAARLFQLAAAQGLHTAMTNLGVMYENGFGVPVDEAKAHELYRMGGRKETNPAEALTFPLYDPRLADLDVGEGLPDSLIHAAGIGEPLAKFQLAWLLLQHFETKKENVELATQYMGDAANAGLSSAQANLGWMYFKGIGVPQDFVLGQMWLVLAKASGDKRADVLMSQLSRDLLPSQIEEAQSRAADHMQSMR